LKFPFGSSKGGTAPSVPSVSHCSFFPSPFLLPLCNSKDFHSFPFCFSFFRPPLPLKIFPSKKGLYGIRSSLFSNLSSAGTFRSTSGHFLPPPPLRRIGLAWGGLTPPAPRCHGKMTAVRLSYPTRSLRTTRHLAVLFFRLPPRFGIRQSLRSTF